MTLGDGTSIVLHVSTELPGGLWMVEPRQLRPSGSTRPAAPRPAADRRPASTAIRPAPGSSCCARPPAPTGCGWRSPATAPTWPRPCAAHGRPIRYSYVPQDWPLDAYQTVFAATPGSAEMPSASRPFTDHVVARAGRRRASASPPSPCTPGVSSLEGHELPYAERFQVPATTAAIVNAVHASGGRVIAAGTTVVRALETAVDRQGHVHPADGWTDTVITPARGVRRRRRPHHRLARARGHPPRHARGGRRPGGAAASPTARRSTRGYLWHEFGDSHLLLPYADQR